MTENEQYVFPDDLPEVKAGETAVETTVVETNELGNTRAQEASATAKVIPDPKEVFGSEDYKSWDDVKAALATGQTTAQELEKLRVAKEELEGKFNEVINPFANDELVKMNEFVKKNPDKPLSLFSAITSATADNADSIEVLVAEKVYSNPKLYLGKEDLLRQQFRDTYGIDETETDPIKKQMAMLKMEEAVDIAKAKLSDVLKNLTPQAPNHSKNAPDREAIAEKWNGHLKSVKWDAISIPMQEGENVNTDFVKFGLTDELKQNMYTQMTDYAKSKGLELTSENIQSAFKTVYPHFVIENLPKIALAIAQKTQTLAAEEQHKILNYPSGLLKQPERKEEAPTGYTHLFE